MSYLLLLVLLFLLNTTGSAQLQRIQDMAVDDPFLDTLRRAYEEDPFDTLFLLQTANKSCLPIDELWKHLKIPLILVSGYQASQDKLKDHFNSNILTVICLQEQLNLKLLSIMTANLQHRRQTRIILRIAVAKPSPALLTTLRNYLEVQLMSNVIAIFNDFYTESLIYRYYPFPSGRWMPELLNQTQSYFPCHYTNLQGKTFITLPGQTEPRTMIYEDASGQQHLSGYIGRLMIAFAEKYNVTFQYLHPVTPGDGLHLSVLSDYVLEGILDLAITLSASSFDVQTTYPYMSYTLESIEWFIVLPCPQPLEYSKIYLMVVTTHVITILAVLGFLFSILDNFINHKFYKKSNDFNLVNVLVNENIFRGVFGLSLLIRKRPILSMKILYTFLFILGLFVNNLYPAYFQSLLMSPPLKPSILTFDDMRRANFKVMFDRNEIEVVQQTMGPAFNKTFKDILQLEDTKTFKRHRGEYDTTFGYSMPESIWPIFELQQQTFERKVFCLAPTLKISDRILVSIPMAENSNLMEPLNKMVLRVIETGLLEQWRTMTFMDMLATGKLSLKDNSSIEHFHDIRVEDMKLPWCLLLCGLGMSSVVFIMEICVFELRKRRKHEK
ncbi:uncharacterized protein LOC128865863 [Anastrepha ludens]|uniref:uncharacterized protein LOC128865863 n=1 Tax=Anastrepha ludens TaxID=28586 RepID=UPI0023AF4A8F|nr:uncharacterized protein LOC128865863 [Anastrepha ludens]